MLERLVEGPTLSRSRDFGARDGGFGKVQVVQCMPAVRMFDNPDLSPRCP